jgi:hypothetical protein
VPSKAVGADAETCPRASCGVSIAVMINSAYAMFFIASPFGKIVAG